MKHSAYCILLLLVVSALLLPACNLNEQKGKHAAIDTAGIRNTVASSPVLSPQESINAMQLEEGFAIKLVAAEPLVNSPVALTFDDRGRIWVCEMQSYMPDTAGTGEEKPTGKIVILEDTDGDGVMDARKVFMDSLVLPRALCLVENGLLIGEPPNLWFVAIRNDQPGKKILVDSTYAAGGNPEHQANGLVRAMDNWIYSANCVNRYRKTASGWRIERTHERGQWGISQDNDGRLFYNNNSQNLLGDYFAPAFGATNTHQKHIAGFNEKVVADNRVYPLRPTPGVNRGYMEGILDDSLRLKSFTAATGPVVYRGGLFGKEGQVNTFVGEPAANLIKKNILEEKGFLVQGREAYGGKEFLSSRDERFRPVTLYNGPDGALYVVDLYRGIIQHKTYLTAYLKGEINRRQLTEPLSCGRIYKILPRQSPAAAKVRMPAGADSLVKLLQHPNGWIRDKAQQMITDRRLVQVVPALRQNLQQANSPLTLVHSLWTLEGLGALQPADVIPLLSQPNWKLRVQALTVLQSVMNKKNYQQYLPLLQQMADKKDTLTAPYLAFLSQVIRPLDSVAANGLLLKTISQYPNNRYVAAAAVSALKGREEIFARQVRSVNPGTAMVINQALDEVINDIKNAGGVNSNALKKEFPKGIAIFNSVCQTCHGPDGNGIASLAPPLHRSEWVTGDKDKLIPIVLYGLTGPVRVNGKVYQAPEINGEMPGIGGNADFTDEDIAQLLSVIRRLWSNKAGKVIGADVSAVREKFAGRQKAFTIQELNKLK